MGGMMGGMGEAGWDEGREGRPLRRCGLSAVPHKRPRAERPRDLNVRRGKG